MTYDPDDSGEYVKPLPQYLDDLLVYDPALGETPLWKSIAYNTAVLRNKMQHRADSAGQIAEEAKKGAPSGQPKLAPPLVADAVDKDEASKMERVMDALNALETRLDALEERKRQQQEEAAHREIAEKALLLAEEIAESAPATMLDALPPVKQRLH